MSRSPSPESPEGATPGLPPVGRPASAFASSYEPAAAEEPHFLPTRDGEQLYVVHHAAAGPARGGIVIAQPWAHERPEAYSTCVRWSRLLARAGFESVRFDYRGTGESSGRFEDYDLGDVRDDAVTAFQFLVDRSPGLRITLHGIRLGAVPISELFAAGVGDAMLLWSAPASARDHFMEAMRFMLATQMVHRPGVPRTTRDELAARLEAGEVVNVGGFMWSRGLWVSSDSRSVRVPGEVDARPWLRVTLDHRGRSTLTRQGNEARVSAARFWEECDYFFPPADTLLELSLNWVGDTPWPAG